MQPLSFDEAMEYRVNRSQEYEVTRQTLYDTLTYNGAAGQTSLNFFQDPNKTIDLTNMELSAQLPAPKYFLVEGIELHFYPGVNPVNVANDAVIDAEVVNFANDVYTFAKAGSLDFFIGSKSYLQEAPLGRFPPKTRLDTEFSFALQTKQGAAADDKAQVSGDYAAAIGRPYFLDPYKVLLAPTQNFNVRLSWSTAQALPSATDATVVCVLDGILYRLSQ